MGEIAVFTKAVAMALLARGYKLKGYNKSAWFFEDTPAVERALNELVESLQGDL